VPADLPSQELRYTNTRNNEQGPSSALPSKASIKPVHRIPKVSNDSGAVPSSPTSSKDSESSKKTTISYLSQKTKIGAPSLSNGLVSSLAGGTAAIDSLGNGLVSSLTDLFDRMAIPKATPEGNESLYSERTDSKNGSIDGENRVTEANKCVSDDDSGMSASPWLIEKIESTLGPKSANADLASMNGKSQKSHRTEPRKLRSRKEGSEVSYGSRSSNYSRFSNHDVASIMSAVSSSMSTDILAQQKPDEITFTKTSRSTLEDGIKRLELQLAALDQKENDDSASSITMSSVTWGSFSTISARSRTNRNRKKVLVIVPPGKLGVILADQHDGNGTVISSIKNGSPVTGILKPGDRLIAVDEIAVVEMSCSQITSLIASRAENERRFTVMTTVFNKN